MLRLQPAELQLQIQYRLFFGEKWIAKVCTGHCKAALCMDVYCLPQGFQSIIFKRHHTPSCLSKGKENKGFHRKKQLFRTYLHWGARPARHRIPITTGRQNKHERTPAQHPFPTHPPLSHQPTDPDPNRKIDRKKKKNQGEKRNFTGIQAT